MRGIVPTALTLLLNLGPAPEKAQAAKEAPFQLECSNGFLLDGVIAGPGADDRADRHKVVILLHGSGPQSMDENLTAVTRDGKRNLFFKEVSDALAGVGFTVIRYHKRSYQVGLKITADPAYRDSEECKAFEANPLKYFVDDAVACIHYARTTWPDAEVGLLGHSQGSYIALQAAHRVEHVKCVALIGFAVSSTETLVLEQTVYRPMSLFRRLDTNGDDALDAAELAVDDPVAATIRPQMPVIDLDADQSLSVMELQAGNLSNLLIRDMGLAVVTRQEATYPRLADILKDAKFQVAFLQGLWDNQTPAY
jgi:pimeloyl-ACP methyl ester carboxylesterase